MVSSLGGVHQVATLVDRPGATPRRHLVRPPYTDPGGARNRPFASPTEGARAPTPVRGSRSCVRLGGAVSWSRGMTMRIAAAIVATVMAAAEHPAAAKDGRGVGSVVLDGSLVRVW